MSRFNYPAIESRDSVAEPPLAGIRVLDFTQGVAGPYAAMLLGDLGADIIRVEKLGGDSLRTLNYSERFRQSAADCGGDYFLAINRNKRSVTLDLQTKKGHEIALRLARRVDVVLEAFRPDVMKRLRLCYESIRAVNPAIIYASLTGYGRTGPLATQPANDIAMQARAGLMSITGHPGEPPAKPGASLSVFAAGVHLSNAVLAALFRRERTGHGQAVHVSMLDATAAMLTNYTVAVLDGGATIEPMGSGHPTLAPFQAFPTRDGSIVIGAGNDKLFTNLCIALGRPDLLVDPRFRTNRDRVAHKEVLVDMISLETTKKATAEWLTVLENHHVPCSPVNSIRQALEDPQLRANGMVVQVAHPILGPLHVLGIPYDFSDSHCEITRHPPRVGEHTREILGGLLDLTDDELDELAAERVI